MTFFTINPDNVDVMVFPFFIETKAFEFVENTERGDPPFPDSGIFENVTDPEFADIADIGRGVFLLSSSFFTSNSVTNEDISISNLGDISITCNLCNSD